MTQPKEASMQNAGSIKTTMEKGGELKDSIAEKTKEGKDIVVGVIGCLKDKALGLSMGKKEEVKEKSLLEQNMRSVSMKLGKKWKS